MDATNSTSIDSPLFYTNKMTIPVVTDSNAFSFLCVDDEMVVQHTAITHDDDDVVSTLMTAAANFRKMNDGLHSAIVHRKQTMVYYIMSISLALRLDMDLFDMLHTTITRSATVMTDVTAPVYTESSEDTRQKSVAATTKEHIRRPRNQFIIYRQWMSAQLHEQNPGLTAGSISTIVSNAWKAEKPNVKAHFKALADEEDRIHKLNHPGYRYQARRNRVEYR
ncbi:sporulation minus regulator 2, partial [Triangularia setosa]